MVFGGASKLIKMEKLRVGKGGLAPQQGCPAGDPALPPPTLNATQPKRGQATLPNLRVWAA
jgi:hypothetical protein